MNFYMASRQTLVNISLNKLGRRMDTLVEMDMRVCIQDRQACIPACMLGRGGWHMLVHDKPVYVRYKLACIQGKLVGIRDKRVCKLVLDNTAFV